MRAPHLRFSLHHARSSWLWAAACTLGASMAVGGGCADDELGTSATSAAGGQGGAAGHGGAASPSAGGGGGAPPACGVATDCPGLDKACRFRACDEGRCGFEVAPSGTPCDEGNGRVVCDGAGTCVKSLGTPCLVGLECLSAQCFDGVCCDVACAGGCEACNLASPGLCTPHLGDTDPEGACAGGAGVCDGGAACTHGGHLFSVGFGNTLDQRGLGVARDAGGAVLVGGSFAGDLDLSGHNPMVNAGGRDAFLMKLSPTGTYNWSRHFGAAGDQAVTTVAVGANNAVFFAGWFETAIQLGPTPRTAAGAADAFVAKLDTNGGHAWDVTFGAAGAQRVVAVALDAQDRLIVFGEMEGSVSFDGGATTLASAGGTDLFLVALDAAGDTLFSQRFGGPGDERAGDLAVGNDTLAITGSFASTVDFGTGNISSLGGDDIFVVALDPSGATTWARGIGGAGTDRGHGVGVDASGHVAITGSFEALVDFGGGALTANGASDVFVARYAPDGTHRVSARYGTAAAQQGLDLEADPSGALVVVGTYLGNLDFGDGTLGGAAGSPDGFLVKLSPELTPLWRYRFADGVENAVEAVGLGPAGDVVITGRFGTAASFGGGLVPHAGGADIFVASYRR